MIPCILRTQPIDWLRLLLMALALADLYSCQSTTIMEEDLSPAPGNHYVHFRVMDSAAIPDSIWYHSPLDSGTESITVSAQPPSSFRILFFPFMNQIGTRDSMSVTSFRMGIRTGVSMAKLIDYMELGTNRFIMTGADSLAVKLFRLYDSLHKTSPNLFPSRSAPSDSLRLALQRAIADAVFTGHPASLAYRQVTPVGLDTADIRFRALHLAASSGLTLGEVVQRWNLGMDYVTARSSLANLKIDSLAVNPFRQLSPVRLDTLHLGESARGLTGKIQGTKGIARLTFSVSNDSGDRSDRFVLADAPDLKSKPIQLDLDNHPTFAPRSNTSLGAYSLLVHMEDSLGNQETYRVPFRVAGFLDHTGPTIRWINPSQSKVFENEDSVLTIQVEANDSSGVDSVWIDSQSAMRNAQTWTLSNWHVPVSDLGVRLRILAQDHFGNRTDSFLVVSRRPAPVFASPTLTLVSPTAGTLVGTEEDSTEIVWKATSPDHKVDSVWIDGKLARNDSGQLWRLRVLLPPTGFLVVIPVRAHSSAGTEARNFAQFGRNRDTVGPLLKWERPHPGDTLPYSTALADIELRAVDHFGTVAVWIGGSPAKLSNGAWKGSALLGAPGSRNQIPVRGQDHFGNITDSVLTVYRGDLPNDLVPTYRPLKPSQRSGVHVPYDSTSIWVRWVISDLSGIDSASVQIDHQPAIKENDSTWGARVALPPASRKFITIIATNKKGNVQADVMEITRDPESSIPKFERAGGSRDTVLFGDSTFKVQWKLTDNALATVKIGGNTVQPTGDIFAQSVSLNRGVQWIRMEAEDSSHNICRDSLRILYLPEMKKIDTSFIIMAGTNPQTSEDPPPEIEILSDSLIPAQIMTNEGPAPIFWSIPTFISDTALATENDFETIMSLPKSSNAEIRLKDQITWYQAILFCNRKSRLYGLDEAYNTTNLDSAQWSLRDESLGFRLPAISEAKAFNISQTAAINQSKFGVWNEWANNWQLEWIKDQSGPKTGTARAILDNETRNLLSGLAPETRRVKLGFRTVLPLKATQVTP
ncbi:MAG: hypothetical protein IPN71_21010 [Fibrobacteres bacterium]|nr:hypothetical protein [Fibrobacterota bacterium]